MAGGATLGASHRRAASAVLLLAFVLAASLAMLRSAAAQSTPQGVGTLAISPTRVVFDDRTRSAEVTLVNRSTETTTYRISFVERRMTEDGRYEDAAAGQPGVMSAAKLVRFSPRQVTIQGPGTQTIRLTVRKPADLPPGEYRSHLLVETVAPPEIGTSVEAAELGEGEIQIRLIALYAISIPVIVRHGDLSAGATIADARIEGDGLTVRIERQGGRSIYGDVIILDAANDIELAAMRGVAVLVPNDARLLKVPMESIGAKRLRVEYRAPADEGGELLAERDIQLP